MNCLYEINSEQEMRATTQFHSNSYTTLSSPSTATMMMAESTNNNIASDPVKQSADLLMVSTESILHLSPACLSVLSEPIQVFHSNTII